MNQRTAKLLRKVALTTTRLRHAHGAYRSSKKKWNTIPRNRRGEARAKLKELMVEHK